MGPGLRLGLLVWWLSSGAAGVLSLVQAVSLMAVMREGTEGQGSWVVHTCIPVGHGGWWMAGNGMQADMTLCDLCGQESPGRL